MARKSAYNSAVAFERAVQELLTSRSASELGQVFGVGQSTVSRWAAGTLVPELWRADVIAEVLNKDTGEVETMIVEAKRARGRPQLERRVGELEEAVGALKGELTELRELLRSSPEQPSEPR